MFIGNLSSLKKCLAKKQIYRQITSKEEEEKKNNADSARSPRSLSTPNLFVYVFLKPREIMVRAEW